MRVFTAIGLPEEIRKKLFDIGGRIPCRTIRVSEPNLHITLQFIGDIDDGTLAKVIDVVKFINWEPFSVCIRGISCFGTGDDIRVVYANALDENRISMVYSRLSGSLKSRGISFKPENTYIPHVTIGRTIPGQKREIPEFIKKHSEDDFGSFEVSEIHVKGSTLTRKGPIYETLYKSKPAFRA